jgi:hypothetical protein
MIGAVRLGVAFGGIYTLQCTHTHISLAYRFGHRRSSCWCRIQVNISYISESPRAIGIILRLRVKRAAAALFLFFWHTSRSPNVRLPCYTHGTGEPD